MSPTLDSAPPSADGVGALAPGTCLAERFLTHCRIGSGGSGTVYSALDTTVGQKVAIKVLHPHLVDSRSRERLRREVRAARPGHANAVAVYELHEHDGIVFLSMELVEGRSLKESLAGRDSLPLDDTVAVGRQVAAALAHLHGAGLVHRDVKPANILLDDNGVVKLCDMGLVRPLDHGTTVTETEMVVGTPAYMAPEPGRGTELTSATYVYALGLVLYRCLAGEVPLAGDTAVETLIQRQ